MDQVLIAVSILTMGACVRHSQDTLSIEPPPNPPLSRPVIGYGVISASYTHVAARPGEEGVSLGYLRKSSIVEVLERRPVNKGETVEIWVLVEGTYRGWLKEEVIRIYDNEAQARTATEFLSP
ncbi:MAG: hypothetical protein LBG76_07270 [Treponema sp.]|jgi:hypothetical protein|nr:hypothetical protein [Treponema sp.]